MSRAPGRAGTVPARAGSRVGVGSRVGAGWQHAHVTYEFEGDLWQWDARQADAWVFVSLPPDVADELLEAGEQVTRGFGSLRVEVTVGATTWRTSVFPDGRRRTFVLPLKRAVRRAEGLAVGGRARVRLRLVDL